MTETKVARCQTEVSINQLKNALVTSGVRLVDGDTCGHIPDVDVFIEACTGQHLLIFCIRKTYDEVLGKVNQTMSVRVIPKCYHLKRCLSYFV